jgi:hypothetical protein
MYDPLNNKSGVAALTDWCGKFQPADTGLLPAPTLTGPPLGTIEFPQFLLDWLRDLHLLRRIPLCYLVPDARLLPPESIRFFHVDPTWIDRVIDGVFAAANLGSVDATYSYASLAWVRNQLNIDLASYAQSLGDFVPWKPGTDPMTGMLIRSELVRRWPDLIVRGYKVAGTPPPKPVAPATHPKKDQPPAPKSPDHELAVLRAESLSPDVSIVLFAGLPAHVQITEPHVALRFGVDTDSMKIAARDHTGTQTGGTFTVKWRTDLPSKPEQFPRTLDVANLNTQLPVLEPNTNIAVRDSSRMIALQLEQPAFVQDFIAGTDEARGSQNPNTIPPIVFSRTGKTMNFADLTAQFARVQLRRNP